MGGTYSAIYRECITELYTGNTYIILLTKIIQMNLLYFATVMRNAYFFAQILGGKIRMLIIHG